MTKIPKGRRWEGGGKDGGPDYRHGGLTGTPKYK